MAQAQATIGEKKIKITGSFFLVVQDSSLGHIVGRSVALSEPTYNQGLQLLQSLQSLGKDLSATLSITMAIMMMAILMTITLLMRFSVPEGREDPHSGLNKLNKEEAGGERGRGKVKQAVGVLEQM